MSLTEMTGVQHTHIGTSYADDMKAIVILLFSSMENRERGQQVEGNSFSAMIVQPPLKVCSLPSQHRAKSPFNRPNADTGYFSHIFQ